MNKYTYQGKTQEGKKVKGLVEAPDEKAAVAALRQRGLIVTELNAVTAGLWYHLRVLIARVGFGDVVTFTRQFATMITAGLTMTESLSILQEQTNPAMGKIIAELLQDVQAGTSLYKAMEKHPKVFPPVYLALIKAGEAAGVLDEVLLKMSDNLEKERDFRSKVKGAMIYPAIVVTGMVIVTVIMMAFVIPKMLVMYEEFDAELPPITQLLINITHLFQNYWVIMLGLLGGGIYGLRLWRKTERGRVQLDRLALRLPIFGDLQRKVILTNTTRTLGMLVGAGVAIIESLNIVAETANNVIFEDALQQASKAVEKGLPLAGTISKYEFFPPIVSQMIGVGEETGKLDEVLGRLARHFEAESEVAVKALTTAIEPLMMIVLGVGVGFMVIAIILPIYNLTAQF